MTKYSIGAKEYTFRFDLTAMEQIENELGGIREMFEGLSGNGGKQIATLRTVFRIMANNGEEYEGRPAEVTGNEIMRMTIAEMGELTTMLRDEIKESMEPKEHNREEGDGVILDDAGDEKNAETGVN